MTPAEHVTVFLLRLIAQAVRRTMYNVIDPEDCPLRM